MFPTRLKSLRNEKSLTQKELGQIVGLSQQTIGHYEVGRAHPDHETLQQLAGHFGVTTDYLLGRTEERNESLASDPSGRELEEFLRQSNVKFDGAPLDDEDKEDIINFLRMVWKRKNQNPKE